MKWVKILLFVFVFLSVAACTSESKNSSNESDSHEKEIFVCTPCGHDCDTISYDSTGTCTHCNMPLVKKSSIVFKRIEAAEICSYIEKHAGIVLLDVRTPEEFAGNAEPDFGSLKNAINIPVDELEKRLKELEAYKNKEVLVYCSHSHRSPRASYILTQNGFTQVSNMNGGMSVLTDKVPCKR